MAVHLHIVGESTPAHHSDRIYDIVLARLQRGEVSPGARLIDSALAQEFKVSRMPARDALMRLANHGYLERSTRGFTLPILDRQEILDVFELRRLIEPQAISHAACAISEAQLAQFEQALKAAKAAMQQADTAGVFRACEVMRNTWIASVPSEPLRTAVMRCMAHIQVVRMRTFNHRPNHAIVVKGYEDLLDALKNRQGANAANRLLRLIHEGETAFLATEAQENSSNQTKNHRRART